MLAIFDLDGFESSSLAPTQEANRAHRTTERQACKLACGRGGASYPRKKTLPAPDHDPRSSYIRRLDADATEAMGSTLTTVSYERFAVVGFAAALLCSNIQST